MNRRTFLSGALSLPLVASGIEQSARACSTPPGRIAPLLRGVNVAGAEFGETFPGVHGRDFVYPDGAVMQQLARQGFNLVRLPFRWERLQPALNEPFDAAEWERLSACVSAAIAMDLRVILDVHNYAGRRLAQDGFTQQHTIGSAELPVEAFEQFWATLAARAGKWPTAMLGLMNEPIELEPQRWLAITNRTVAAIRNAGSENLILIPGIAYTGAFTWYAARNTLMEGVRDPKKNIAFEVHQYLDVDASGSHAEVVNSSIGSERIEAFQEWARARGFKAFLGEFAAGADPVSLRAVTDLVSEVEQNSDVWIGWSAWAGGPWWPADFPFRVGVDADGQLTPVTAALVKFATGQGANTAGACARLDLDLRPELHDRGHGPYPSSRNQQDHR